MFRTHPSTILFSILLSATAFSQDSTQHFSPVYSGYIDAYAAYYTDSAGAGQYQKFYSVSPRSHQAGLNVASITAKYADNNVRGIITLHYGDIPRSAWSAAYNFIQEANAGIRLSGKLWLEGGFFRTHVGTEGLFPKENITSSVAVCTFMEPYYQAGFKFIYSATDKLSLNLFLLNGYNVFEDNNKKKSVGFLATYTVSDNLNIGYNNYFGDESPDNDSVTHARIYQNIFMNYQIKKIKIQIGADYAMQDHSDILTAKKKAVMFGGVASFKYRLCSRFFIYSRGEICKDPEGFLSGTFIDRNGKLTGINIWGVTLGSEYKPADNSYIRFEGRDLIADSDQKIFRWNDRNTNTRLEFMLNFGLSF